MYFIENIEYFASSTADILIKKKWSIITSKEKVFVTSDRPVIITNPKTGFRGIEAPGAIIYLPLSPTRILVLEDNVDNDENLTEYPLKNGHAPLFNQIILSNVYRYFIGHKDLEKIISEIFEYDNPKKKPWWKFYS